MTKSVFTLLTVALILLIGFLGIRQRHGPTETGSPPGAGASGAALTAAERTRIESFWAIYRQASQEKQAGRWAEAVRDYRQALQLNPSHWDTLYYLGGGLVQLRRYRDAEAAYRRLVAAENQPARAHAALGALYANPSAGPLFDLAKAEREFQAARRANADESGPILRLGEVALAAGETARAREYLQAAGRTNFKSVTAPFLLGYIAWRDGDARQALTLFGKAISLTQEQPPPAGVLGEGDTRLKGHRAMVLPEQQDLFDGFVAELWQQKATDEAHMTPLYMRIENYLQRLPGHGKAR
ncbi:MAG TPA: tetratricopeptide repeat protein [Chthonomonadaceae bacterium]|nr:tetratricopeptide repeat protein [Chthonomonadaceae bacterium]